MKSPQRLCDALALTAGVVHAIPLPRDARNRPRTALVLRDQRGIARAYLNLCQHLPIPLDAGSGQFLDALGRHLLCRTHGAKYRLDDGRCVEGPCVGTALPAVPIEERDGGIYLDLGTLPEP